jgi:hypothetical protein
MAYSGGARSSSDSRYKMKSKLLLLSLFATLPVGALYASDSTESSAGADIASHLAKKLDKITKAYPNAQCEHLGRFKTTLDKGKKELDNVAAACSQSSSSASSTASSTYTSSSTGSQSSAEGYGKLVESFDKLRKAHDKARLKFTGDCKSTYDQLHESVKSFGQKLDGISCDQDTK